MKGLLTGAWYKKSKILSENNITWYVLYSHHLALIDASLFVQKRMKITGFSSHLLEHAYFFLDYSSSPVAILVKSRNHFLNDFSDKFIYLNPFLTNFRIFNPMKTQRFAGVFRGIK